VSTPVTWDEIDEIHTDQFAIASLPSRLELLGDPWLAMNDAPQSLEPFLG
jgi:DNA primase